MKISFFEPLGNRVLLEMAPRTERTAGGIFIPERSQRTENVGTVRATGSECHNKELLADGVKVQLRERAGTEFQTHGKDYIIALETDILGLVTE